MTQQLRFSGRLTTILIMAGMAIGLGNVWRFPYMMGQHGGSAFLFIYVLFMVTLAVPALASEWSLGRATRSGPVGAFRAALGHRLGTGVALVLLTSVFITVCYYCIVVGNVFFSAWFALREGFTESTLQPYRAGLGNHWLQFAFSIAVVAACSLIVMRGLKNGIELANRLLIPLFALVSAYLVYTALSLDGALPALLEFLKPDFSQAGPDVWFAAMGQACFSVGLSGTLGVMYGSYLRDEESIIPTAFNTGLLDTGAALLGTLFVIPAVLVFGLNMAVGPGLMFETMPHLFSVMPGGRALPVLFLLGWGLVAMLTIVCAFDTISSGLASASGLRPRVCLWLTTLAATLVVLPVALNPHWIGVLDLAFGSGMFMVGSLLVVIATGWGLGKVATLEQIGVGLSGRLPMLVTGWIRYVVPLALAAILVGFLLSLLNGAGHG